MLKTILLLLFSVNLYSNIPTTPDTLIGSCFKFDKDHIVSIALPDGTTEKFRFKFARECGHYFEGSFYDAPKLYALNGSQAKLEVIDASNVVMMNTNGEIIDDNTFKRVRR